MKDPNDKHKIIIDEKVAWVVRKVFDLALEGLSMRKIAQLLNEKLGKIEVEDGKSFVSITIPADFVSNDITQESLDKDLGKEYISATVNPDGSVTYKMTKKQHKAMLESVRKSFDTAIQELVDSPDFAFAKVDYNEDFTVFDVHLSTDELGMAESFMVLSFYVFGGAYGFFLGHENQNITVNFYSQSGNLLETVNSSDLANAG